MVAAIREYMKSFIETHGADITLYNVSSTTYSSNYHDATTTYGTAISTYGLVVPEVTDLMKSAEGELKRAGVLMILPYDQTGVANKSKITYNSINYEVTAVNDFKYKDSTIAKQVMLSRLVST